MFGVVGSVRCASWGPMACRSFSCPSMAVRCPRPTAPSPACDFPRQSSLLSTSTMASLPVLAVQALRRFHTVPLVPRSQTVAPPAQPTTPATPTAATNPTTPSKHNEQSEDADDTAVDEKDTKKPTSAEARATLLRVARLARPEAKLIGASMASLAVTSSISLVFPYALGKILDISLSDGVISPYLVAGGLLGLFVVQAGIMVARSAMLRIAGERVVSRFRKQLFAAVLAQDVAFFDKNRTGDLMNRLSADTQLVQRAATSNLVQGLRAAFMAIGGTFMLFYTSPSLAMLSVSVIPPVALGARYFGKYMKSIQSQVQDALAQTATVAEESFSNIRTVRQFGAEAREAAKYDARVDYSFLKSCQAGLVSAWFEGGVHLAANTSMVAVLAYGGSQVMSHHITAGALTSFLMYSLYVGFNVSSLSSLYSELMRAVGASARIFAIVDRKPAIPSSLTSQTAFPVTPAVPEYKPPQRAKTADEQRAEELVDRFVPFTGPVMHRLKNFLPESFATSADALGQVPGLKELQESTALLARPDITGNIEFKGVSFSYPLRPHDAVLQGMDLVIPTNGSLALVGSSGSGKSTVGSLLTRLYDTDSGTISVDGHDIRSIDPHWLRRHIGVVAQEPALFATTVGENIRYGKPGATDEEVLAAAEAAGALSFLNTFPQGLDTPVGERGVQLSGGQKQRVAVARVILKDPPIVLLDEATSALDAESEHHVQHAIERMMKGRTVVSIAHRLSTMKAADRIAMLEDGRIVESGSFDELMGIGADGKFYNLVHRQLLQTDHH